MKNENISKKITEQIESGKIKMKSAKYFAFLDALSIVGSFIIFMFIIFFVNIEIHAVKEHNAFKYLTCREYGLMEFLQRAPIINFVLGVVLMVILIILIANLGTLYKTGRLRIGIMFAIAALVLGLIIDLLGLNNVLDTNKFLMNFYLFKGNNSEVFITGWISRINQNEFQLSDKDKTYILDCSGMDPTILNNLHTGNCEMVHGEIKGSLIHVELFNPSNGCDFPQR